MHSFFPSSTLILATFGLPAVAACCEGVDAGHAATLSDLLGASGESLVGTTLELSDGEGHAYEIRVAGTGTTYYWAGTQEPVTTYVLTYTSALHPTPQPLCTAGANEALLYTGDRYDAAAKTVMATGAAANDWLNIACAGTALAKLYLTRHTEASEETPTTREQRQAMLKMFTGDVCGDGTSFTVPGQPLLWADGSGLTRTDVQPASLEAVWSDRGAVCLDEFRIPANAAAIAAHCGRIPRCEGEAATAGGYVTSANPH
jgi:hypothetical protein